MAAGGAAAAAPATAAADTVTPGLKAALAAPPQDVVDPDRVEQFLEQFRAATPQQMREYWRAAQEAANGQGASRQAAVLRQLILTQWATKDGEAAAQALIDSGPTELAREAFPRVMEAWAANDPHNATKWYFADKQKELRSSRSFVAGERFAHDAFRYISLNSVDAAVNTLDSLQHVPEVWGAVEALETLRDRGQIRADALREKLKSVKENQEVVQSVRQFRESMHTVREHITDPKKRDDVQTLMGQKMRPDDPPATPDR